MSHLVFGKRETSISALVLEVGVLVIPHSFTCGQRIELIMWIQEQEAEGGDTSQSRLPLNPWHRSTPRPLPLSDLICCFYWLSRLSVFN